MRSRTAFFFTWETMRTGRLRLVERAGQGIMELEGTPDMLYG
jgi:hypothetical protein